MPGLVRKLLIIAAVDGLILQPYGPRNNSNRAGNLQIEYKTRRIHSLPNDTDYKYKNDACLESHGLVGLLSVASYSFLISITQSQQVAHILGRPIFVITGVTIIPLSSQADASKVIGQAKDALNTEKAESAASEVDSSGSESDDSEEEFSNLDERKSHPSSPDREIEYPPVDEPGGESSIAENVIKNRGRYGRFGPDWFSRKGWARTDNFSPSGEPKSTGSPVSPAITSDAVELDRLTSLGQNDVTVAQAETPDSEQEEDAGTSELMLKFLKYTKMMLGSRSFYFSYDYDITRRFSDVDSQSLQIPLCNQYFWNRNLMKPLIESGKQSFVLPIMQGFIGQQEFTPERLPSPSDGKVGLTSDEVEETIDKTNATDTSTTSEARKFLLTLISRRSVKRSGLRYLRRGVDDDGHAANTVETEQVLSDPSWNPAENIYSLLQLRGSIPLYFSQSPYYFKPVPVLRHSAQTNQLSFQKHFNNVNRQYGKVCSVCLLDKHGVEANIGETYERYLDGYNESEGLSGERVAFQWFDFHSECRGMKFENVKRLVATMVDTLDDFGDTVIQNNKVVRNQTGIVRTNCMDCLDRTGVTQCAFGQRALEQQLEREGYTIDLHTSKSTRWFNILWADNGDAISKQYSSTAALKGDYTRTRKRDYRGAFNDLGLTLTRYYNNIVTDYFSQACIDYLLGDVTIGVFDEFQMDLESADPGISIGKLRQNAIETSRQIVISDESEEFIGGWMMLSPRQPNTLRTLPFDQSVLLLTDAAVYCCRFDWNTEKVTSFERIDLRSIASIKYGTYITSTLTEPQMDEKKNVGLVIAYRPDRSNTLRVNTRSLQSLFDQKSQTDTESTEKPSSLDWDLSTLFSGFNKSSRFVTFKLPGTTSVVSRVPQGTEISELDTVRTICEDIERMITDTDQSPSRPKKESIIEEKQIISLDDARKQTGYFEHLIFDIKKLVWS